VQDDLKTLGTDCQNVRGQVQRIVTELKRAPSQYPAELQYFEPTVRELLTNKARKLLEVINALLTDLENTHPKLLQECSICLDDIDGDMIFTLPCGHDPACRECTRKWILEAMDDATMFPPKCRTCQMRYDCETARQFLEGHDEHRFDRMWLTLVMSTEQSANKVWCPKCGEEYEVDEDNKEARNFVCSNKNCTTTFCVSCKCVWHDGFTCEQYQAIPEGERSLEDRHFLEYVKMQGMKRCPSCGVPIEKISGCSFVRCSSCKEAMCWATGKKRTECGGGHGCH